MMCESPAALMRRAMMMSFSDGNKKGAPKDALFYKLAVQLPPLILPSHLSASRSVSVHM